MFHHSELALLEESLSALPWESLLENPRLVLLQAWLMQSQHRYSEVNTLLARAEQEMTSEMDTSLHGDFNALRAQVAIYLTAIRMKPNVCRPWRWKSCRWLTSTAVLLPPLCMVKCCTAVGHSASPLP